MNWEDIAKELSIENETKIVLFVLDGVLGVWLAITEGIMPGVGGLLVRAILVIPMAQGIGAIRTMRRQVAAQSSGQGDAGTRQT